jgi:hypothetical protein
MSKKKKKKEALLIRKEQAEGKRVYQSNGDGIIKIPNY